MPVLQKGDRIVDKGFSKASREMWLDGEPHSSKEMSEQIGCHLSVPSKVRQDMEKQGYRFRMHREGRLQMYRLVSAPADDEPVRVKNRLGRPPKIRTEGEVKKGRASRPQVRDLFGEKLIVVGLILPDSVILKDAQGNKWSMVLHGVSSNGG